MYVVHEIKARYHKMFYHKKWKSSESKLIANRLGHLHASRVNFPLL